MGSRSNPLQHLPHEILNLVFSNLPFADATAAANVCKLWCALVVKNKHLERYEIDDFVCNSNQILYPIRRGIPNCVLVQSNRMKNEHSAKIPKACVAFISQFAAASVHKLVVGNLGYSSVFPLYQELQQKELQGLNKIQFIAWRAGHVPWLDLKKYAPHYFARGEPAKYTGYTIPQSLLNKFTELHMALVSNQHQSQTEATDESYQGWKTFILPLYDASELHKRQESDDEEEEEEEGSENSGEKKVKQHTKTPILTLPNVTHLSLDLVEMSTCIGELSQVLPNLESISFCSWGGYSDIVKISKLYPNLKRLAVRFEHCKGIKYIDTNNSMVYYELQQEELLGLFSLFSKLQTLHFRCSLKHIPDTLLLSVPESLTKLVFTTHGTEPPVSTGRFQRLRTITAPLAPAWRAATILEFAKQHPNMKQLRIHSQKIVDAQPDFLKVLAQLCPNLDIESSGIPQLLQYN